MSAFAPFPPVPAPSVTPPIQPWQVHTDRRAVNRLHGAIVTVHSVLLVLILAVMTVIALVFGDDVTGWALAPFMIMLLGQVFQIGYHCYVWGARSTIQVPLTVSAQGLSFTTARGPVRLPWNAVASMSIRSRLGGRVLTIRPQPGVRVDSPGVEICYPPRVWTGVVRRGMLLGSRGLAEDLDQVVAMITSASGGRVALR